MNCTNCGKPLKEGTAVCSACGKEVVLTSSKNAGRTIKHSYSRRKNKVKKALSTFLIILLAAAAVAGGFYFFEDWKKDNTKVCSECKQEFLGKEEICDACLAVLEAEYDSEEAVKHFCNQCAAEFESEALICDKCLGNIDESFYDGNYFCNICKSNIDKELITIADTHGYVYCIQCDSGIYCQKCFGVLGETDDDSICKNCAAIVCHVCEEVLNKSEVGFEEEDKFYCAKCYEKVKKKVCSECEKELAADDDDKVCLECAKYHCDKCKEVLEFKEIARENGDKVYCEACEKEEKFCSGCGILLNADDDDSVCRNCAEYCCEECGEVLKDTEIAATGDDGECYCKTCFKKINDEILKNIDKTGAGK